MRGLIQRDLGLIHGCFYKWLVFFVGVLEIGALLDVVYIEAPLFQKLPDGDGFKHFCRYPWKVLFEGNPCNSIRISLPNCPSILTLGLQIGHSRSYLHTLGPKVGIIYILGAPGFGVPTQTGRSGIHSGRV